FLSPVVFSSGGKLTLALRSNLSCFLFLISTACSRLFFSSFSSFVIKYSPVSSSMSSLDLVGSGGHGVYFFFFFSVLGLRFLTFLPMCFRNCGKYFNRSRIVVVVVVVVAVAAATEKKKRRESGNPRSATKYAFGIRLHRVVFLTLLQSLSCRALFF